MVSDVWISLLAMGVDVTLLFLAAYFVITLSDLECDYLNATTCCKNLNKWVLPELICQTAFSVILFLSLHFWLFLLNMPLSAWILYRFFTNPSGNIGLYDPTEIHNRYQLKSYMKESMIKLGCFIVFFFIYLYWFVHLGLNCCVI